MSATPMQVLTRPIAIEPVTNIMLPDGIFDNAIYNLQIACHFTNTAGSPLTNVSLYLESVGDPGIVVSGQTFFFAQIPVGASVQVKWNANFQHATPGKRLVSFIAQADGYDSSRSIQQIFVSQTRFNSATNTYTCTVEEGTLTVSNISALSPKIEGWGSSGGNDCCCRPDSGPSSDFGPWVPTGCTAIWQSNPAYAGTHGDLPFSDPWWKILALIVLIVAAIVAVVAAALGAGAASFNVKGTFDESQPSIHCCTQPSGGGKTGYTVAGVASAIASAALAVACSDEADPFWRGQEATPPAVGELTTGEKVVAKWSLSEAPNAGVAYPADVSWTYTRFTTGGSYEYSVNETQTNTHTSDSVEVTAPNQVKAYGQLWAKAKFHRIGGALFKGPELYAFALFRAPQGLYFVVPLTDDGLGVDDAANDGIYAGVLDLERISRILLSQGEDVHGIWRIYVFAQDINPAQPGSPPQIAAQHISGFFVASAISITFDPSLPCPLKAQATIMVV